MEENELFELVRRNYAGSNNDYFKQQVKESLKNPMMPKDEVVDGLVAWIVDAGCTGMNEHYRKFIYSAISYLMQS